MGVPEDNPGNPDNYGHGNINIPVNYHTEQAVMPPAATAIAWAANNSLPPIPFWNDDKYPIQRGFMMNDRTTKLFAKSIDYGYCVHKKPGSRRPVPVNSRYNRFSQNCKHLLEGPLRKGDPMTAFCDEEVDTAVEYKTVQSKDPQTGELFNQTVAWNVTRVHPSLKVYLAWNGDPSEAYDKLWYHCWDDCTACFDAMDAYGAAEAICRHHSWNKHKDFSLDYKFGGSPARDDKYPTFDCGMGVISGDLPLNGCENGDYEFGNCKLDDRFPRWREFGYTSLEEAMNAGYESVSPWDKLMGYKGDLRTLWVSWLPWAGAEHHLSPGFGLRWVLRHILSGISKEVLLPYYMTDFQGVVPFDSNTDDNDMWDDSMSKYWQSYFLGDAPPTVDDDVVI